MDNLVQRFRIQNIDFIVSYSDPTKNKFGGWWLSAEAPLYADECNIPPEDGEDHFATGFCGQPYLHLVATYNTAHNEAWLRIAVFDGDDFDYEHEYPCTIENLPQKTRELINWLFDHQYQRITIDDVWNNGLFPDESQI